MNSKQQKALKNLFDTPVKKNIKWTDIEKLMLGVDGQIRQGDGSRVRIVLGDISLNIHTPHPHKELKPYQVRAIRKLFIERGIEP
ncbi:MAG: type II toxin-antitoxin system HicA family toxin [Gammaproteobacteria bacterium]|nr:type II toxin-antitoxin system HicA family toxin [Gammaproteobacteria bacterium]